MRLLLCVVLLSATLTAQTATAPTLDGESGMALRLLDTSEENLMLRIALVKAERERLLASLRRDGFAPKRGPDGMWAYQSLAPQGGKE